MHCQGVLIFRLPLLMFHSVPRRFARRIHVPLPDKATRSQLVQKALKGVSCDLTAEQYLQLADKVAQYSGRDLVAVCRYARVTQ